MKSPLLILHLEDNLNDAELIRSMLEAGRIECNVVRVETREDFLKAFEQDGFDLIISDYTLPSFNGLAALQIAQEKSPEIPFVFVSGTIGEDSAIDSLLNGATDYVLKNKLSRLVPAIRRALHEAEQRKEQKRAEEKIREQAALLDIDPDAILVVGLEGRILFWSKGAERLYGWTREEAVGKQAREILFPELSSQLEQIREELLKTDRWSGEFQQKTKDDRELIVESSCVVVRDNNGNPKAVYIVISDITEKKKLESQFLRAQRMESIGTLTGGIAHDLNNVLAPILVGMHVLRKQIIGQKGLQVIATMEASAKRGADIVKQVLTFARGVEGERVHLQPKTFIAEMEKIVKETFPKSIQVRGDIPDNLWTISGDDTQLHQVLLNLCVNARDAMPKGGILTLAAENFLADESYARMNVDAKPGPYVLIKVSDMGTGIPPELIEKIFEPFFTTKEVGKGTGLGLSTVIAIMKSHGGFVKVYSESGRGTTFNVYLPALPTTETVQAEREGIELPAGDGELVLVVEDEIAVREITRQTLEMYNYKVITANDGTEAVAQYAQHRGDIKVVLTDMMMPFMDGPAMIRALRNMDPKVKIIATSGLPDASKSAEASELGVHAFLPKPYTAEKLLKTLHEVLKGK